MKFSPINSPICLLLLLLLTPSIYNLCADPNQPENSCTSCVAVDVLINGTCYVKIRGCLTHASGPICLQCQFGYVLVNTTCIRQAVFNNNTNLNPQPIKPTQTDTLTLQDIKNKIGNKSIPYFMDSHQYFLARYTQQLGVGNIIQIQSLQTKTGTFIIILYEGTDKTEYLAVSFISLEGGGQPIQWSFQEYSGNKDDLYSGDVKVRAALVDKIKQNVLYQVNQQGITYTYDYINNKSQITRVIVNKQVLASPTISTSNFIVKNLDLSDLAIEQLSSTTNPQFSNYKPSLIQKIDEYYIMNFGPTISVSFRFYNYIFTINNPLQFPLNTYKGLDPSFKNVVKNNFNTFSNFSDSRFIASGQFISKEFQELLGAQITKVQYQTLNTQNISTIVFLFNFKKSVDQYQFLVWFNSSKLAKIIQAKRNGKIIYQDYYNYNADSTFLSNYRIVQNGSRIINIPPIKAVSYKQTLTKKYYKVLYSNIQFSQFQYQTDTNKANLISYYIDGQNLLETLNLPDGPASSTKLTAQYILSYLKSQQKTINQALVSQLSYNLPTYIMTIVTNAGTFKSFIQARNNQLSITQFAKISSLTCFQLSKTEIQTNQKINLMNQYIKNNYPLDGYDLQLVQINVQYNVYNWRMLYSNDKQKQISAYLDQQPNVGAPYMVKIVNVNQGFQVLNPNPQNSDYKLFITAMSKLPNLSGNKIPFFTQQNGITIKGYYDDGKSTYQLFYNKSSDTISSRILSTRSYLLIPQDFSLQNLLLPGTPNIAQTATITKIVQQILRKYTIIVRDATVVYLDKKNNTYNVMYKGSYGYQKLSVNIDSKGLISVGRLVITPYKDTDFSNCKKYQTNIASPNFSKCLSCDVNTQVQYQGACHNKLEGCLIQPGPNCIKCNNNYVKIAQRCVRDCTNFFVSAVSK